MQPSIETKLLQQCFTYDITLLQLAIIRIVEQEQPATVLTVQQQLSELYGHSLSVGAVYTTLHRMRVKKWFESELIAQRPIKGGRERTGYHLSTHARQVCDELSKIVLQEPSSDSISNYTNP